ncbi:MAG TPA: type IV secretion system protein [Allosphingosinicella sp.]|nr:type IV secretion system protein [Allosphingosinicella sp.]
MIVCAPSPAGAAFVRRMLDFVDCQAQAIGAGGYQALAAPGSMLSIVLTGLLTLFVALLGYRMLFGHTPAVRDGVLALVKIGVVLALATSWTAYRTLIYDVALRGPAELAANIGRPAALPGAGGALADHLAYADQAFERLAAAQTLPQPAVAPPPPGTRAPEMFPGFNTFALGWARVTYLVGALGALALVRLTAGLLLGLGPFFIAFLLFDGTRGLFEGWVRVLAGAALGALGTAIVLGVELALLEPWLADLLARRYAGQAITGAPVELLVATLLFALVLIGTLFAAARVALGFRMRASWRAAPAQVIAALRGEQPRLAGVPQDVRAIPAEGRSRVATVVDAVNAAHRRETAAAAAPAWATPGEPSRRIRPQGPEHEQMAPASVPLGRSFRRRTTSRVSASAGRRDISR